MIKRSSQSTKSVMYSILNISIWAVPGIIGSLQACEAIKIALGITSILFMLNINLLALKMHKRSVKNT